jgi:hypothetical protein
MRNVVEDGRGYKVDDFLFVSGCTPKVSAVVIVIVIVIVIVVCGDSIR